DAIIEMRVRLCGSELPVAVFRERHVAHRKGLEGFRLLPRDYDSREIAIGRPRRNKSESLLRCIRAWTAVGPAVRGQPGVRLPLTLVVRLSREGDPLIARFAHFLEGRCELVDRRGGLNADFVEDVFVVPESEKVDVSLDSVDLSANRMNDRRGEKVLVCE